MGILVKAKNFNEAHLDYLNLCILMQTWLIDGDWGWAGS